MTIGIAVRSFLASYAEGAADDEQDNGALDAAHGRLLVGMTIICGIALAAGWALSRFDVLTGWLATLPFVVAYFAGGSHATVRAARSLAQRHLDIDLLMIVAATGAAVIGQWTEGGMLLFLFSLGNALQAYAMDRTYNAVRALMQLSPEVATVMRDGVEVIVPVEEVMVGDRIVIRPGERVAIDGVVESGESAIDQSAITGESMPASKRPGDTVFSGTINGAGALVVTATRVFAESTLAKIISIVEEAQGQKSSAQRFTDRFEGAYAGIVIAAAALYWLVPMVLLGRDIWDTFYRSMVLLVVASPCALVISTPASILSALANLARRGVLVKGAAQLEALGSTKVVAIDKTGTLTIGQPRVTALAPRPGVDPDAFLALAAAAEGRSEHPLAQAIVDAASERNLELPTAGDLTAHGGRGIETQVGDRTVFVGSMSLMVECGIPVDDDVLSAVDALRAGGNTIMVVGVRDEDGPRALGAIGVADTPRSVAADVIRSLSDLGVDHVVMLTGDNRQAALAIARQVGIDDVRADLLPKQKLDEIEQLKREYGNVVMVGDGVNDAPALATATVGVSMGAAGSDVALETADVVLMSDDLKMLPYSITLSRKARRIIVENLAFALTVIGGLVVGTLAGVTTLPIGVLGHEGSTIIVVANGLRLLRGVNDVVASRRPITSRDAMRPATAGS